MHKKPHKAFSIDKQFPSRLLFSSSLYVALATYDKNKFYLECISRLTLFFFLIVLFVRIFLSFHVFICFFSLSSFILFVWSKREVFIFILFDLFLIKIKFVFVLGISIFHSFIFWTSIQIEFSHLNSGFSMKTVSVLNHSELSLYTHKCRKEKKMKTLYL